ncbi:uncharacterized protein SCHCODRAFT_01269988 [Schizophyllum commune H4-8]|uniref:uncharacterized protein n=1 Tax=Schizophyllum commune (strain H4-8 / FGSC 9210) TaxID=578458 RepID=UPI00215E2F21|nr:uncharacterized protein SCHCODRAFT_01269988 [Schizophyllum commune H4-8]KAI5899933.1 hypothetical protein SCHCODRAFT_01269988 [Schizophyllum commune H4-8]
MGPTSPRDRAHLFVRLRFPYPALQENAVLNLLFCRASYAPLRYSIVSLTMIPSYRMNWLYNAPPLRATQAHPASRFVSISLKPGRQPLQDPRSALRTSPAPRSRYGSSLRVWACARGCHRSRDLLSPCICTGSWEEASGCIAGSSRLPCSREVRPRWSGARRRLFGA